MLRAFSITAITTIAIAPTAPDVKAQIPHGSFSDVINVGPVTDTSTYDYMPVVSEDGLTLYFSRIASTPIPGNQGPSGVADIWMATRGSLDEQFGNARRLEMNTDAYDVYPSLSNDGLVLFTCDSFNHPNRPGGNGAEDIYVAARESANAPFEEPVNLNDLWPETQGINTGSREGTTFISPDWPADGSRL